MPLPSEATRPRSHTLAWAMALIALIAADLAALQPYLPLSISIFWTSYPWSVLREPEFLPPRFPNLGIVVVILVLEIAIFRLASRRGRAQVFWLGFEVAGWAGIMTSLIFASTIWWQARLLFEGYLIGRQISHPLHMGRFVLFTGGLHLLVILTLAYACGLLSRSFWPREESDSTAPGSGGVPVITRGQR